METMNNEIMNEVTMENEVTTVPKKSSSAWDVALAIAVPAVGGFAAGLALHDPIDAMIGAIVHHGKKLFGKKGKRKAPVQTVEGEIVEPKKD